MNGLMMKTMIALAMLVLCVTFSYAETNGVQQAPWRSEAPERGHERFVMVGAKYDSITGPTASACVCWHIDHPDGRIRRICSHDFWILQAEVGRGGGKLQCGVGTWYMVGGAAKVSILRTWGEPGEVEAGQTYAGVECQGNFFLINATIGVYARIYGDYGDEALLTWSAGIGF